MTRTLPALALAVGLASPALADDDFAIEHGPGIERFQHRQFRIAVAHFKETTIL